MMTLQQIFDFAATRIIAQGKPSFDGNSCKHAGPDGTACAVGQFLDRDVGHHLDTVAGYGLSPNSALVRVALFGPFAPDHLISEILLLCDVQTAHDSAAINDGVSFLAGFRVRMATVAKLHGLNMDVLA